MTREEAKRAIYKASKEDTSSPKDCIHLLSLHRFIDKIYDEHEGQIKAKDERIRELEEAQLTRREWYQKGYNEAMKPKTCEGCVREAEDMRDLHCVFCSRACNDKFEPKDNE